MNKIYGNEIIKQLKKNKLNDHEKNLISNV